MRVIPHFIDCFWPVINELILKRSRDYYRQNYPDPPYLLDQQPPDPVVCPVLVFHGLDDRALGHEALNRIWEWLDKDLTLVTLPGVGHNSHFESPEFTTGMLRSWLMLQKNRSSKAHQ